MSDISVCSGGGGSGGGGGGGTTPLVPGAPTTASVGLASAQILAANASRLGLVIQNTSQNTVSIAFGSNAAVVGSGITLYGGGVWVMNQYTLTTEAVNAIASAASSPVGIQEFSS